MTSAPVLSILEATRGAVITERSPDYDQARAVYNAMIDRRPLVIVRAVDVTDVRTAVAAAREGGLDLAVRAGAHSVPGFGTVDDGIVLDLSSMKGIRIDPERRIGRVQAGCTWGDFDHAAHAFGLATTGGVISTTGVSGLTLGGGIGYLARAHGLSIDNLRSVDVVLADGRFVTASEDEHADLFWALRGGGGNFGVVTELEFDLHPVDTIYGGPMFFELDVAEQLFKTYREWIAAAPREMSAFMAYQTAPPLPFVPENRVGEAFVMVVSCFNGHDEAAETLLNELRAVGPPVAEHVGRMPYPTLNCAFDALLPRGLHHYWKAAFQPTLTDGAIAAHCAHGPSVPTMQSTMHLYPIDGAVQDVAAEATAFPHRGTDFASLVAGIWSDPASSEANVQWVRDYYAAIEPHASEAGYINFMVADDQSRIRVNYGPSYDRLATIKKEYDPTNLFHLNQNIAPAE